MSQINSQLTNEGEQAAAQHAVDVMLSLGIRFVSDKNDAGNTIYRIEPPLDEFVEGLQDDLAVLRAVGTGGDAPDAEPSKGTSGGSGFAVRHYLARELAKAEVQRAEQAKAAEAAANGDARAHGADLTKDFMAHGHAGPVLNLGPEVPVAKDFFGRPIVIKPTLARTTAGEGDDGTGAEAVPVRRVRPHPKVTFRYNEGFSNAVRKNVKLNDLL